MILEINNIATTKKTGSLIMDLELEHYQILLSSSEYSTEWEKIHDVWYVFLQALVPMRLPFFPVQMVI